MSLCNITKTIPSNQCIGDSLRTINSNFSNLDSEICNLPQVGAAHNSTTTFETDLYKRAFTKISSEIPIIQQNEFGFAPSHVPRVNFVNDDSTQSKAYKFSYASNYIQPRPFGTFEAISNGSGYPEITVFWAVSANGFDNNSTVYATNSGINASNFNDTITALYKDEEKLYVGGTFTTINGNDVYKFAIVDLRNGQFDPVLGFHGSLMSNPLSGTAKNLGVKGVVNTINKQTIDNNSLLIIGGDFESETVGKGLTIFNETIEVFYSFYVNGVVYNTFVDGGELFVVGEFDYINYGLVTATESSNQRIYSNGVVKINLNVLINSPLASIDTVFSSNIRKTFKAPAKIYSVVQQTGSLYLGGDFQITTETGEIGSKNLAVFDGASGIYNTGWLYIFNRPVLTLFIDNPASILYVGGEFTNVISYKDLYVLKKSRSPESQFFRAVAFSLKIPQIPGLLPLWKPKFNGTVSKIIAHDTEVNSPLYVTGQFTEVNNDAVGYIAAITKTTEVLTFNTIGRTIPWNLHLSTAPPRHTNALAKSPQGLVTTLLVGGNFTNVNGKHRRHLANVAGIGQGIIQTISSTVAFEAGGTVVSQNQKNALNFKQGSRTISEATANGQINKTSFAPLTEGFKGLTKNQMCRFYIRRPGNAPQNGSFSTTDDTFQQDVYILGWSINFDSQKDY